VNAGDDWWAGLVVLAATHVGLGVAIPRSWVFALPVVLSVGVFLASGAEGLAWLTLIVGAPVLVAFTAAGWALGRAWPRRRAPIALALFAVALLPVAWAAIETSQRGPHVPASVQRELPTKLSLGNLCPGAESSPEVEREVRRSAEALIRELRRRPDDLVTDTVYYSDDPEERRDITIRELAEEQLEDIESNGPNCVPDLERRIRAAM
jgi:hypothetical protein